MGAMSARRIQAVTNRFQIFRTLKRTNGEVTVSELCKLTGLSDGNVRSHLKVLNMKARNARQAIGANVKNHAVHRPDVVAIMQGQQYTEEPVIGNTEEQ